MEKKVNELANELLGNEGVAYDENVITNQQEDVLSVKESPVEEPVNVEERQELVTAEDEENIKKFLSNLGFSGSVEEAKKRLSGEVEEEADEFISEYKSYKQSGKDIDEFLEEKYRASRLKNLDSEEGLKEYFRSIKDENNRRKYSDDDIESFLSSKSKIEKDIMWNDIKKNIKTDVPVKSRQEQNKSEPINTNKEYLEKVNEYNTNFVDKILSYAKSEIAKSNNEIYGLNVGEPELKEFDKEFEDLVRIDASGEPMIVYPKKVLQYINNPVELYKMLFIKRGLDSGKYILLPKSKISEMQEQILEKMGVAPKSRSVQPKTPARPPKPEEFV